MAKASKRGVWGWMFFDWASQPYHTLLITFIFAPYFTSTVVGDSVTGQSMWGYATGITGILIAIMAPFLGALADATGPRKPWIFGFSVLYVLGAGMLWLAVPGMDNPIIILIAFGIGLIGVEFATVFTNAMLPDLGEEDEVGRISGSGWAMGYVGGLISLFLVLLFMTADSETGLTLLGAAPIFGLDPTVSEGERATGPLTAIWYIIFVIPLFLFTPDVPRRDVSDAFRTGLRTLKTTVKSLGVRPSFRNYLLASMFYRDALNGLYAFGGIYALGVLGWEIIQVGIFGILAAFTGAIGAFIGGRLDSRFGPRPVIMTSIVLLTLVCILVVLTSREAVFGIAIGQDSNLPDIIFYICGGIIGAAGGALQAASRTMLVHQAGGGEMTQAFGLYALVGKATAFLAPLLIGFTTQISGSQQIGVSPVVALFLIGFVILFAVKRRGEIYEEPA